MRSASTSLKLKTCPIVKVQVQLHPVINNHDPNICNLHLVGWEFSEVPPGWRSLVCSSSGGAHAACRRRKRRLRPHVPLQLSTPAPHRPIAGISQARAASRRPSRHRAAPAALGPTSPWNGVLIAKRWPRPSSPLAPCTSASQANATPTFITAQQSVNGRL